MKEWESRLRSCVRTRVQLFGQDIKLVRVTLVSAGTQSSGRLLENKWKNTITSPKTEVLASNKGGPITTTMAARVQNDSTNRSLNTRANWIKKQVEERKNSACRWVLEEATAQLHLTAKEKRKKVGEQTQLLYVVFFERFQLTCGSSLDKKQTAVSQVIESKLQVWLN